MTTEIATGAAAIPGARSTMKAAKRGGDNSLNDMTPALLRYSANSFRWRR
jgi:hypothetical protein